MISHTVNLSESVLLVLRRSSIPNRDFSDIADCRLRDGLQASVLPRDGRAMGRVDERWSPGGACEQDERDSATSTPVIHWQMFPMDSSIRHICTRFRT